MKTQNIKSIFRLTLILTLFSFNSFAQKAGDLDSTFGGTGIVKKDFGANFTLGRKLAIQPDGKILACGLYGDIMILMRYNSNGTLDNSFGNLGKTTYNYVNPATIIIQDDGKIVIGGNFTMEGNRHGIAFRYNIDGSLDNTFGKSGVTEMNFEEIMSGVMQIDKKIILVGSTDMEMSMVRLNSNGIIDSTFGDNGCVKNNIGERYSYAFSICIQPDEKIILGGTCEFFNGTYYQNYFTIARYNNDGKIDSTFAKNGIDISIKGWGTSIDIQNEGSIIIAGNIPGNGEEESAIVKYYNNGLIDSAFGENGVLKTLIQTQDYTTTKFINNKIFLVGCAIDLISYSDFYIAKYNLDGSPDYTFGSNGKLVYSVEQTSLHCFDIASQTDGKILVIGGGNLYNPPINENNIFVARFYNENIVNQNPNQQICSITCDSTTQKNAIIWEKPLNEGIASFNIRKESGSANNYVKIGNVPFDSLSKFIDVNSDPKSFSYKYKISVVDTLNQESALSDFQRTMQLVVNQNVGGGNNLIWTDYMISSTEYADSYTVYRGNGNNFTPIYTNVLPSGSGVTTMLDDGQKYSANFYKVGYKLKNSCSPSKSGITEVFSNTVEVIINDIENANLENEISIYPTLVENLLTVKTNNSKITKIEILNSIGQTLISSKIEKTETFDFSKMPKGIYFVKVLNENDLFVKKLIKQ